MAAQGNFIMLIDDELIVPTHIETMLKEISDYDLVYSDVEIVNYQFKDKMRIPKFRLLFTYELDLIAMRTFSKFVPSGCFYRSELHKTAGVYDTEVHNYGDFLFASVRQILCKSSSP
jgi:hypothetical protein